MDAESKAAIKNYFSLMDFFVKSAQGCGEFSYGSGTVSQSGEVTPLSERKESVAALRKESERLTTLLKSARIFSIPNSVYTEVWNVVDEFVTAEAGCELPDQLYSPEFKDLHLEANSSGVLDNYIIRLLDVLEWPSAARKDDPAKVSLAEGMINPFMDYMSTWPDIGRRYPTRMPFGTMYLGYGEGIELSSFQLGMRFRNVGEMALHRETGGSAPELLRPEDFASYKILGHLIGSDGEAWEMSSYTVYEPLALPKAIPEYGGRTMSLSGKNIAHSQLKYLHEGMSSPKFRAILNSTLEKYNELLYEFGYKPLPGSYKDYTLYPTTHPEHGSAWTFGRAVRGFAYYSAHVGSEKALQEGVSAVDPLGYWCNPWSLSPWILPTLVDLINENNKTFVFNGTYDKQTRREIGKDHKRLVRRKKKKAVLPAYYVIDVKPKIVRARSQSSLKNSEGPKRSHKLTHRHDRDGHERVLVKRGPLPLLEDDKALLEARGYVLYTDTQPASVDKDRLVRRRLPLREPGEWLAVKTSWVSDAVVGDASLPYRPALRRLSTESIVDLVRGSRA